MFYLKIVNIPTFYKISRLSKKLLLIIKQVSRFIIKYLIYNISRFLVLHERLQSYLYVLLFIIVWNISTIFMYYIYIL